ncbi:EEIG1/EHBP1 N-terminal domain-containing protein, partial [Powellomyces hirtus]
SLFVPKSRKVKFEASCFVHDLSNLPYVSGLYFVKWKLKNGGSFEGSTAKAVVKDHTVTWDISFRFEPQMVIGKDGVLQPCELVLFVKQTVNAGKSTEDVGMITINLAEYANSKSTCRRYLLQESRVNSILKVTIGMKLTKG